MPDSAWPYKLQTPTGYKLKITFLRIYIFLKATSTTFMNFFWPWLLYSLPIYRIFWLITFRGASIKCQVWWKLAKTTGAMLEPVLSCSAWGVTEIDYAAFVGGLSQRAVRWIAGSSGIKLLIHAEPCYCSCHSCCQLKEKILECSALMESLQGLMFRLLGIVTKRQNKFSWKWLRGHRRKNFHVVWGCLSTCSL